MKKHVPVQDTSSAEVVNTSNKRSTTENVSQVKNTWVFFDDKFSMIAHVGYNGFSLMPEWLDRMIEYKEYRTINRHGEKIKT
jgi:hypothetical protein